MRLGAALIAANAALTAAPVVLAATPLEQAVDYCAFETGGSNGRFAMPAGSVLYQPMDPSIVAQMRVLGNSRAIGPTSSDVPDLVKRFAQTQPISRVSDLAPIWFYYWSFGGKSPTAWAVSDAKTHACEIMVTGNRNFVADRDTLISSLQRSGWLLETPTPANGSAFWTFTMTKEVPAGSKLMFRAEGLGATADRNGIQMSLTFTPQAATNPAN
ncbi:hypothetical protein [Novosphingobium sp. MMS21-SN21R]|uniref:hypothetical protein n=1 Tax=Novosphingobium sp. MMS21-SN21R TaxID=2969298 RepID=UPI002887F6E2|nr:hypothetical protein [Novosphingobium sp. MMS21-SN21R]MDT0507680.1 hypothetical protein [Novosphingobium sp. MMS21-SN21R]